MLRRSKRLQRQQPRKKKPKKPVQSPTTTPRYNRRHFEELNYSIWIFTHDSHSSSRRERKRELERDEIDQQWTQLIQRICPADDPKSYELLAQVECPIYDGYWEKRLDEKAFVERAHRIELCAFNKSRRNPTRAQKRNWPGCMLMEDSELNDFVVSRISLLVLQQVDYVEFVKSVLQANPLKAISRFTMQELWVAVVTGIYHFEDTVEKELKIGETNECTAAAYHALAEDYRSAYEVAKARVEAKRGVREGEKREREDTASHKEKDDERVEEEEQGKHNRDGRAGKRQRIQQSGDHAELDGKESENTARHLGAELEEVGAFPFDKAAWQDLGEQRGVHATFQFADTGLAFRFRG